MLRVTDASQVLPGRCFVCERSFDPGESATNTQFTHSPDWDTRMFGNKMICDNCVADIAVQNGFVPRAQFEERNRNTVDHVEEIVAAHRAEIEEMESRTVDPEKLAAAVAEIMKPKTRSTSVKS